MRLGLHPGGLASRIRNFGEWRAYAIASIKRRIELTADRELIELLNEVQNYPFVGAKDKRTRDLRPEVAVPLELETSKGDVRLVTTTMVFGTPNDVMVSELAVECFFPQDEESAKVLRELSVSG